MDEPKPLEEQLVYINFQLTNTLEYRLNQCHSLIKENCKVVVREYIDSNDELVLRIIFKFEEQELEYNWKKIDIIKNALENHRDFANLVLEHRKESVLRLAECYVEPKTI